MGLGDQLEKGQELDVGVTRVAGVGGDLAGGDLQRGEQAGGAVANVIVGLLLGNALAQRQNRLGPIQRLDLAFLIDAEHDRALAVESAWGAVPGLLSVRFPRPLAEPGVRVSTHRALHGPAVRRWLGGSRGWGSWCPGSGIG